jgi:proline iminopeptidase
MWGANDYVCTGSLASWSRLADLHRIRQPTLVIHGEHDEFTPAEARQMHARLPDSRLVIIPESSHTPFMWWPHTRKPNTAIAIEESTTNA